MSTHAAVRIAVAALAAAAALGTGVATMAHHSRTATVWATTDPTLSPLGLLERPPGHPIETEPACPNCFI